jgi:hypothetical protein
VSRPRLRPEDFATPALAADAVNRLSADLDASTKPRVKPLVLQVGASVASAFPLLVDVGDLSVGGVRVRQAENLTNPGAAWSAAVCVFWRRGPGRNIEVQHISGLAANTVYRLSLALEE